MNSTDADTTAGGVAVGHADLKLEAIVIPVTDVDRSKAFYSGLGWRLDADFAFDNGFRVVQFTPPGSPASIQFGSNITTAAPGSAQGVYLVVSDVKAARDELAALGAEVTDVFHPRAPGAQFRDGATTGRQHVPAPGDHQAPSRPDRLGHHGVRLGERPDAGVGPRRDRPRRTREADRGYDEKWPEWYAAYMVAEQSGAELPQ